MEDKADYKVIEMVHYEYTYSGGKESKEEVIKKFEAEVIKYIERGYIPCGEMKTNQDTHKYKDPFVIKYYTTYTQPVYKPLDKTP